MAEEPPFRTCTFTGKPTLKAEGSLKAYSKDFSGLLSQVARSTSLKPFLKKYDVKTCEDDFLFFL